MDSRSPKSQQSTMDQVLSSSQLSSSSSRSEELTPTAEKLKCFVTQMDYRSEELTPTAEKLKCFVTQMDYRHEEIEMEKQDSYSELDVVQHPLLSEDEDLVPPNQDRCFEVQLDNRFPQTDSQSLKSQVSPMEYEDLPVKPFVPYVPPLRDFGFQMESNTDSATSSAKNEERNEASKFVFYFFAAIAEGNLPRIKRCLLEIQKSGLTLSFYTVRDWDTGKTCLMKALLKPNKNTYTIMTGLLAFAEQMHDLKELVNAEYKDPIYEGHTALHIAIEKKQADMVRLLVSKGANVSVRAYGLFFHLNKKRNDCFYFGEYPLSLAACTNQPDLVEFLLENEYNNCADITAQDYLGNTVLHALVTIADDSKENMFVIEMYNWILRKSEKQSIKARNEKRQNLEKICNNEGLTPLQLAAKTGKLQILTHILGRTELDVHHLSRKFMDWAYGPVCCSLYDLSEVDTREKHSVLETVVYNTTCMNNYEMLDLEPLKELLKVKWRKFAAAMFYLSAVFYLSYIITYSLITSPQPLTNQTSEPDSKWKVPGILAGQVYTFLVAFSILIRTGSDIFLMYPTKFTFFLQNGTFHVLFVIQALLVLCTNILHWVLGKEYVSVPEAFAVVLGWFNVLYYARGLKITGIYSVMIQQMIFRDVLRFLFVYSIFLVGFGTALASLMEECSQDESCSPFATFPTAILELFKLTLGLGDLTVHEQSRYPAVFLILLVMYVILTFVLLLNMLIALMGETVNEVSQESEKIWKLQRAMTVLDMERNLPKPWIKWLQRERVKSKTKVGVTPNGQDDRRTCLRVNEVNWKGWSERMRSINEDPGTVNMEEFACTASHLNA